MRKSFFRFSVPLRALSNIPDEKCNVRKQGGEVGLLLRQAPHIILSPGWGSFVTFSDVDFLVPPRVMGIAGPEEDANILRALALYLNSSLVSYYLFFHVPECVNSVEKLPKSAEIKIPRVGNSMLAQASASQTFPDQVFLETLPSFLRDLQVIIPAGN